jgi:uncharacterized membrane protein (DUF373 family)
LPPQVGDKGKYTETMNRYLKISIKLLMISALFVVASIISLIAISVLTQNSIHPDYWEIGISEKIMLLILFALYGLVMCTSIKKFKRHSNKNSTASPNHSLHGTR